MFDAIETWILAFDFTGRMGLMLYWAPVLLCAYGYTARTFKNYRTCCEARDKGSYFVSDTMGSLIGRAIATFVPVVNLLAAVFDLGPRIFGSFFSMLGRVFDKPLVSKKQ